MFLSIYFLSVYCQSLTKMATVYQSEALTVESPSVRYTEDEIFSTYDYEGSVFENGTITPTSQSFEFKTTRRVPKTGALIVGLGGNNGSTLMAGVVANKKKLTWMTKEGEVKANWFGSLTQASSVRLGVNSEGADVYTAFSNVVPMLATDDLVVHGWDISKMNLGDALRRAQVIDWSLQEKVREELNAITPLPGLYDVDFIASNQEDRADNVIPGTKSEGLEVIRQQIRDFKAQHNLDNVIVLWSANTERFTNLAEGVHDTADNLLAAIARNESEISPSTIYAVASILEGCTYINGSPQNTFVPGLVALAEREGVLIAGDDFKSGQTKIKSIIADFLISCGMKLTSVVSYNHLGNNDGKNLQSPLTFKSKETTKSNVIDDIVGSNKIIYDEGEHPDHCVVIEYVPTVGDSKRALDEYCCDIYMGGRNTMILHNTCEDSLLATPLIIDLIVMAELCQRIQIKRPGSETYESFHPVLSLLSYMLKAPQVKPGTPIINALFSQRQCIVNMLRACVGLPAENFLRVTS